MAEALSLFRLEALRALDDAEGAVVPDVHAITFASCNRLPRKLVPHHAPGVAVTLVAAVSHSAEFGCAVAAQYRSDRTLHLALEHPPEDIMSAQYRVLQWHVDEGKAVTCMTFSDDGSVLCCVTRDCCVYLVAAAALLRHETAPLFPAVHTPSGLPSLAAVARNYAEASGHAFVPGEEPFAGDSGQEAGDSSDERGPFWQMLPIALQLKGPAAAHQPSSSVGVPAVSSSAASAASAVGSNSGASSSSGIGGSLWAPTCCLWWCPAATVMKEALGEARRAHQRQSTGDVDADSFGSGSSGAAADGGVAGSPWRGCEGRYLILGHASGRITIVDLHPAIQHVAWSGIIDSGSSIKQMSLFADLLTLQRAGLWRLPGSGSGSGKDAADMDPSGDDSFPSFPDCSLLIRTGTQYLRLVLERLHPDPFKRLHPRDVAAAVTSRHVAPDRWALIVTRTTAAVQTLLDVTNDAAVAALIERSKEGEALPGSGVDVGGGLAPPQTPLGPGGAATGGRGSLGRTDTRQGSIQFVPFSASLKGSGSGSSGGMASTGSGSSGAAMSGSGTSSSSAGTPSSSFFSFFSGSSEATRQPEKSARRKSFASSFFGWLSDGSGSSKAGAASRPAITVLPSIPTAFGALPPAFRLLKLEQSPSKCDIDVQLSRRGSIISVYYFAPTTSGAADDKLLLFDPALGATALFEMTLPMRWSIAKTVLNRIAYARIRRRLLSAPPKAGTMAILVKDAEADDTEAAAAAARGRGDAPEAASAAVVRQAVAASARKAADARRTAVQQSALKRYRAVGGSARSLMDTSTANASMLDSSRISGTRSGDQPRSALQLLRGAAASDPAPVVTATVQVRASFLVFSDELLYVCENGVVDEVSAEDIQKGATEELVLPEDASAADAVAASEAAAAASASSASADNGEAEETGPRSRGASIDSAARASVSSVQEEAAAVQGSEQQAEQEEGSPQEPVISASAGSSSSSSGQVTVVLRRQVSSAAVTAAVAEPLDGVSASAGSASSGVSAGGVGGGDPSASFAARYGRTGSSRQLKRNAVLATSAPQLDTSFAEGLGGNVADGDEEDEEIGEGSSIGTGSAASRRDSLASDTQQLRPFAHSLPSCSRILVVAVNLACRAKRDAKAMSSVIKAVSTGELTAADAAAHPHKLPEPAMLSLPVDAILESHYLAPGEVILGMQRLLQPIAGGHTTAGGGSNDGSGGAAGAVRATPVAVYTTSSVILLQPQDIADTRQLVIRLLEEAQIGADGLPGPTSGMTMTAPPLQPLKLRAARLEHLSFALALRINSMLEGFADDACAALVDHWLADADASKLSDALHLVSTYPGAGQRLSSSLSRSSSDWRSPAVDILPPQLATAVLSPACFSAEATVVALRAYGLYSLASSPPVKVMLMLTQAGRPDLAQAYAASALGYGLPPPPAGCTPLPPAGMNDRSLSPADRSRIANLLIQCAVLCNQPAAVNASATYGLSRAALHTFLASNKDYAADRAISWFVSSGSPLEALLVGHARNGSNGSNGSSKGTDSALTMALHAIANTGAGMITESEECLQFIGKQGYAKLLLTGCHGAFASCLSPAKLLEMLLQPGQVDTQLLAKHLTVGMMPYLHLLPEHELLRFAAALQPRFNGLTAAQEADADAAGWAKGIVASAQASALAELHSRSVYQAKQLGFETDGLEQLDEEDPDGDGSSGGRLGLRDLEEQRLRLPRRTAGSLLPDSRDSSSQKRTGASVDAAVEAAEALTAAHFMVLLERMRRLEESGPADGDAAATTHEQLLQVWQMNTAAHAQWLLPASLLQRALDARQFEAAARLLEAGYMRADADSGSSGDDAEAQDAAVAAATRCRIDGLAHKLVPRSGSGLPAGTGDRVAAAAVAVLSAALAGSSASAHVPLLRLLLVFWASHTSVLPLQPLLDVLTVPPAVHLLGEVLMMPTDAAFVAAVAKLHLPPHLLLTAATARLAARV